MVRKANDGFKEGRVTKQNLASWLLLSINEKQFEKLLPSIRSAHRDPVLVLQAEINRLKAARKAI